jgi:hypothetical protein
MKALGALTMVAGSVALAAAGWIIAKSVPDISRYLRIRRM